MAKVLIGIFHFFEDFLCFALLYLRPAKDKHLESKFNCKNTKPIDSAFKGLSFKISAPSFSSLDSSLGSRLNNKRAFSYKSPELSGRRKSTRLSMSSRLSLRSIL